MSDIMEFANRKEFRKWLYDVDCYLVDWLAILLKGETNGTWKKYKFISDGRRCKR